MLAEIEFEVEDVEAEVEAEVPFAVAGENALHHVVVALLLDGLRAAFDLNMTIMTIMMSMIVIILAVLTPLQLVALVAIKHTFLQQLRILWHRAVIIKRLLHPTGVVMVVVVVHLVVSMVIEVIQDLRNIQALQDDMELHQHNDTSFSCDLQ